MTSTNWRRLGLQCVAFGLALLPLAAAADPPCKTISFKPGASSAEIRGEAPAEGVQCLRFGVGKGQTVRVSVKSPQKQVAFTIDGLVDNREKYQFTSEQKTYDLLMHQTFNAVTPVGYVLTLSIK